MSRRKGLGNLYCHFRLTAIINDTKALSVTATKPTLYSTEERDSHCKGKE